MVRIIQLLIFLVSFFSHNIGATDSLSYSGRLVNSDGSPVVGPVKLKFDLAYTDDLNNILCTHQIPSSDLVNGVFHAKLSFTCPDTTLVKVLESIPLNNSIAIRVTNESPATPKVYSFQALNSVPYSIMANFAKQLSLAGTASGQVLTWNGSAWTAADPVGTPGGVTTISAEQGLSGVKVDDTVTIGILDGGVTAQKLHPMGAMTTGQVLKWNGSNWEAGVDADTGITSEADPLVRKFARTDITGIVPPTCTSDKTLQYISATDSFICNDIVINSTEVDRVRDASVADAINDAETTVAPSQNAVFDALAGKQSTLTSSSDITLKYLKLMTDGAFWVGLKAPISTAGNILFTLPSADGTTGQVLKTDGSGNLSWVDAASGTLTEITTSVPLSGSGTSGSVALSINYDNSTIGLNGSNALAVKNAGISNAHIGALAGIDWSKINKTGATASDVGAVPTARTISTSTGLLGGGDLSANRTLSVDVGTTAGKIVQVDGTDKLPAIDGSQLTNLLWSQVSKAGSTNLIAGVGLNGGGDLSADRTFDVDVGTTAGKIVQLDGAGKLPAVDGSQLTNLGTDLGKWSNATGGIHYSAGNVGVGTTAPAYPLQVVGAIGTTGIALDSGDFDFFRGDGYVQPGAPMVRIRRSSTNATMSVVNVSSINNPAISIPGVDFNNPDNITLFANGNAFFKGNVGIGNTNPDAKLVVQGGTGNVAAKFSSFANIPQLATYRAEGTEAAPINVSAPDLAVGGLAASAYDGSAYQTLGWARFSSEAAITGPLSSSGYFSLGTRPTGSGSTVERMRITSSGKVGIGTSSPERALDIVGDIRAFANESYNVIESRTASDANLSPHLILRRSRGTVPVPAYVQTGDTMGLLTFRNHTATQGATVASYATENQTAGSWGANLAFFTIANGSTVNSERMRIDQTGNVGIGTSNPSGKLTVTSTTGSNVISIERPAGNFGLLKYSTGVNRRWEMGVSSSLETGSNVGSDFGLWSYGDDGSQNQILFVTRSTGYVGIGKPSPATKLNVEGAMAATGWVGAGCEGACSDVASGYAIMYADGRGVSTVGWTTTSDIRLKENFLPLENNLDKILKIRGFNYNYKDQPASKKQIGVIAQEVQKVFPETISQNEDGFLSVDYPRLVAPVIEAIRELYHKHVLKNSDRIEKAERKIAAIESENAKIKAENALLKQRLDLIEKKLTDKR